MAGVFGEMLPGNGGFPRSIAWGGFWLGLLLYGVVAFAPELSGDQRSMKLDSGQAVIGSVDVE